uniref:Latrophilin-2 n=1 Tax=Magallana gigas TaxID=29159 RepID=K1QC40_MAGGI
MLLLWSVWLVPLASAKQGSTIYNPRTATPQSMSLACENSVMKLDCERKKGIIRITRANYGRFTLTTCKIFGATNEWNVSCRLPESKRIVAERCDGYPKCEIMASSDVFGDPCRGTVKYLQVYYTCEPIDSPVRPTPSQFCQSTESLGVMWPRIKVGQLVEKPCPEDKLGMMSWKCTGAGWRGRFPDTGNCVSPWLNSLDQLVNSSSSSIEDVANKLKEQTGTEKLGAGDLKKVSDIITKMGRGFKIPGSVDKKEKRDKLEKFSKAEFVVNNTPVQETNDAQTARVHNNVSVHETNDLEMAMDVPMNMDGYNDHENDEEDNMQDNYTDDYFDKRKAVSFIMNLKEVYRIRELPKMLPVG